MTARRRFLKNGLAALGSIAIVPRHVLGGNGYVAPSDQITLAFIGTGKQARGLAGRFSNEAQARILAGCDIDKQKLDLFHQTVAKVTRENASQEVNCDTTHDYHALLDSDNIDAVVIATPDHWHAKMSIDAMKAGKDVFCEKPLAHTVDEGRRMVKAAEKYGRVLQTGSMQRSREGFRHAVELVRNGYVGDITKVLVNVGDPAIICDLESQPTPSYLDWQAWIGPSTYAGGYHPMIAPPVAENVWAMWRQFGEFGGGILSDWGAHMFDIAQWGLDMDHSGPVLFIPPSDPMAKRGLKMIYDSGIEMVHEDFDRGWAVRFIGSKGTLDVSRSFLDSKPANIATVEIGDQEKHVYHSDNHYLDWLDAIKKRSKPICDVETGHRSSSLCNLANIAYLIRKPLRWDPVKEKFADNKPANALLSKKYKKPYKLAR
ncbi:MAG: Gfo/Idh/MocA family oxidoreductase [Saprospiraceae bacterium]|nr:Gfo/Idh/MocA family oxidoreductase [Saprospiraceae bacterium]